MDSVFFDTPLSEFGAAQAKDLHEFLSNVDNKRILSDDQKLVFDLLNGEESSEVSSVFVVSNLRRALQTAVVATWNRFKKSDDKMKILSSLQEISRNVDTQSLLAFKEMPRYSFEESEKVIGSEFSRQKHIDTSENYGNKGIFGSGERRLMDFCQWSFLREEDVIVVAGGHSLWFRLFFDKYLPKNDPHQARTSKMANCGVVVFDLHAHTDNTRISNFVIDPASIEVLYGGFISKKKM